MQPTLTSQSTFSPTLLSQPTFSTHLLGALRDSIPTGNRPPKGTNQHNTLRECYSYHLNRLRPLWSFSDLNWGNVPGGGGGASTGSGGGGDSSSHRKQPPEVFVLFASMGNLVMLLKAMTEVWEISNQLRVVANASLFSTFDNRVSSDTSTSSSSHLDEGHLDDDQQSWGKYSFVRVLQHMKQEIDTSLLLRDWSMQPTATTEDQPTLTSISATTTATDAAADNVSSSSTTTTSSRELHRLWSALHFLFCASHSRPPILHGHPPESTPFTIPLEPLGHDVYRFGDGITVAGCVLLHLMDEQPIFEICDVSYNVLNACHFELHSRPIDAVMGLGNKKQLSKFVRDKQDFFGMMQAWTTGGKSDSFEQQQRRGTGTNGSTAADRRGSHTSTTSDGSIVMDSTLQNDAEQFVLTAMTQHHIQQQIFAFLHAIFPLASNLHHQYRTYRPPKE